MIVAVDGRIVVRAPYVGIGSCWPGLRRLNTQVCMLLGSRHASAQTDGIVNVHDRPGRGGWLLARRQQRAEVVLVGRGRQALQHVGKTHPPRPVKRPEEFPSFSRPKPLSLRLENGLLQHRTRARAPQSHRKKPRLGFFRVV